MLYKVMYYHPNWGWTLYEKDLEKQDTNDSIINLIDADLTDAYSVAINPIEIRVYSYLETTLVKSFTVTQ